MQDDSLVSRLLETIDTGWRDNKPPDLIDLVRLSVRSLRPVAILELAAANLEWCWRMSTPSRPREAKYCEHYWQAFPSIAADPEMRKQLITSEFLAQSHWDDPPLVTRFLDRFAYIESDQRTDLVSYLVDSLDNISLVVGTRFDANNVPIRHPLGSPVSIGRRRNRETYHEGSSGSRNRWIVAPGDDRQISRRQAVLERSSLNRISIANVSKNRSMIIGSTKLRPGERFEEVFLPTQIKCGELVIRLALM